jgi:hypothetical protein
VDEASEAVKHLLEASTADRSGPAVRTLVFRSFLALSLVRGARGHAGDEWFVDLAV